jgi:hypothetical protein
MKYISVILLFGIVSCSLSQSKNKQTCIEVDTTYDTTKANKILDDEYIAVILEGKFLDTINVYCNDTIIIKSMPIKSLIHPLMLQYPINIRKNNRKNKIKIMFINLKQCIEFITLPQYHYYYILYEDNYWAMDCSNFYRRYR